MLQRLFAIIIFILAFPFLFIIGILIIVTDGRPVLFKQKRIGKDGKIFTFFKFRSMYNNAQKEKIRWKKNNPELWEEYVKSNFKLKNDFRITKIGKILRKTSLDELPQLLNIIKGEMEFVGPRPILLREKKTYGKYFKYYIKVRPGITGLWQVSGRSSTSFIKRVACDVIYSKKKNLFFDICIICKTFLVVFHISKSY